MVGNQAGTAEPDPAEPIEVCARCGHTRPWHSWVYAKNLGFHAFVGAAEAAATPEWRPHTAMVPNPDGSGYLTITCEPDCGRIALTNPIPEENPVTWQRKTIPGWEGAVGPFRSEYNEPHVYARDIHSGAGNCVCGSGLGDLIHVQAAPGVPVPDSFRLHSGVREGGSQ